MFQAPVKARSEVVEGGVKRKAPMDRDRDEINAAVDAPTADTATSDQVTADAATTGPVTSEQDTSAVPSSVSADGPVTQHSSAEIDDDEEPLKKQRTKFEHVNFDHVIVFPPRN
jgi:hypothetical protein